ncbi:RING-type E3 ubiquitin transferase [Heracleum sosnowskyi]|uniref:U-box domain-containing protein n=1 Tax=Heracleum sosnowskyi TaxID=360622 RepID=A0AAD8I8E6_9APIA|nr:RING-type E3 ubiquitin transferase [Heracleum sosnowskyi]
MISSWRKIRASRHANKRNGLDDLSNMEVSIPTHFRCPISLDLMKDPVTLSTGITYDRHSIETWIEAGNKTCPITKQTLSTLEPIPNHTIRKMIQDWCVDNSSYGIERIPTPRIPVSSHQVTEILSKIVAVCRREEASACQELVAKIKRLVKENERNKRCFVANGTVGVLASTFEAFSKLSFDKNVAVLEEILSCLSLMTPLDGEAKSFLGSNSSLNCMVWFLKSGDLSARANSVVVLKHVLSTDQKKMEEFSMIEGSLEALVKVIKEPVSPTTTKASLLIVYYMVSTSSSSRVDEKIIKRFIGMGLIERLLQMLVDCDKSICEKALGVLDGLCLTNEGREKAYDNALTMPVLVKKILRVSDLATEFSVSIVWKLSKNDTREDGGVLVEALQVGAFQKLLLLLQFGCNEKIKDKATELLKLLNLHREKLECIDSMDFKNLKRP